MEKLQKLNRVLFTIMSIMVILLVCVLIFSLLNTFFFKKDSYEEKKEMLSKNKVESLLEYDEHAQIISFINIHPVRGSQDLIIIPVTQVSLDEPQKRRKMIRIEDIEIPTYPKYKSLSSSYGYYNKNLLLNNLLIYSLRMNNSIPIFNKRICITDFINYTLNEEIFLYIVATDEDSNKDGVLDDNDLKDIYIYNITLRKMQKITESPEFILNTSRITNSDNVIIKVGIDKNGDGEYSIDNEPVNLKTLNVANFKYVDFIDMETQQKLQDILDGK